MREVGRREGLREEVLDEQHRRPAARQRLRPPRHGARWIARRGLKQSRVMGVRREIQNHALDLTQVHPDRRQQRRDSLLAGRAVASRIEDDDVREFESSADRSSLGSAVTIRRPCAASACIAGC